MLRYCDEILADMDAGKLPSDSSSDLLGTKGYFEVVKQHLGSLGATPLAPLNTAAVPCAVMASMRPSTPANGLILASGPRQPRSVSTAVSRA